MGIELNLAGSLTCEFISNEPHKHKNANMLCRAGAGRLTVFLTYGSDEA